MRVTTCVVLAMMLSCACVLGAVRGTAPAGMDVTIEAELDAVGAGSVVIRAVTNLKQRAALVDAVSRAELDDPFKPLLLGEAVELRRMLTQRDFNDVRIDQTLEDDVETTTVSARVGSVGPLALFGGDLTLAKGPGDTLVLEGTLGGRPSSAASDLSALRDVTVTLAVRFPGSVESVDTEPAGTISYAGNAVTWRWNVETLLTEGTRVAIRVIPVVEGRPWFWLTLILVVCGVVVLGVTTVLQKGRDALGKRPDVS